MTHLTSDELVDALDGVLAAAPQAHLDACLPCQQQLVELGAVLGETRGVDMPEPSPLYWQHLSNRVRDAIDAEPVAAGGWGSWVRWPVLAPIAALALVVMALVVALPRQTAPPAEVAVVNESPDTSSDDSFALVADLVGEMDWDTAMSAGLSVEPGAAELAVLELTDTEQQELTRLLRAELSRAKS